MTESKNIDLDEIEKITYREKLAYAFANLPGTFFGSVMGVIQSFYYAWMGLQWTWIVVAQIVYAVWNVVNDPIFGNKINNTRYYNKKKGEYQRYMPYIKFGAPIFSLAFALVFFPPGIWRGEQELTIQVWMFIWYMVTLLMYDTMFTLVLCAHVALLPQMTLNQREREQTQLLCSVFALPAILIGFIVPVIFLADPTAESVLAFQFLVIVLAIFGVIPYWILSSVVNEHSEHVPEEQTGLIESLKLAFKNKSFIIYVIYDGVSVFIINILIVSLPFYLTWYLNTLPGFNPILFWLGPIICLFISVYIELKIADKKSTKAALTYSQGVLAIGFFFIFIVSFTLNWILVSIGFSIFMLAFSGDFIFHNPMRSDTIDWDELKVSGERREGLYAGIGPLLSKPMISVALAIPPSVMAAFGLIYVESAEGLVATQGLDMARLAVNISIALIPGLVALFGALVWIKFYPLTGKVVKEMKLELLEIHKEKRKKLDQKEQRGSKT